MCQRRCKDGFVPQKPKKVLARIFLTVLNFFQVICNKNEKGKFKWSGDLGGCKSADAVTTAKPDVTTVAENGGDDKPSCKVIELKPGQVKSGVTVAYKVNSSKFPYLSQIQTGWS